MFKYEHIGNKKRQEDCSFVFKHNNIDYYFVLDGHGYEKDKIFINDFLKQKKFFYHIIKKFFTNYPLDEKHIIIFFKHLDNTIKKNNINSGACLTGAIVDNNNNLLYILNIGDTMCYMFKNNKLVFKTKEHNLKNNVELERIKKYQKTKYINNGRYKNITMTRVLGDTDCKDDKLNPIIPTPEINKFNINDDMVILLSTDGIKFKYDIKSIIDLYNNKKEDLEKYCLDITNQNLLKYKNNSIDNVLFIIVSIKKSLVPFSQNKKKIKKNITEVYNNFSNQINHNFIYNCLNNLFN